MNYLKVRCQEVLEDLEYSYTDEDVEAIAKRFDEEYNPFYEEYQNWRNIIEVYYGEHYEM